MGNMSYCRFQNTLGDLRDCLEAIREELQLSDDETKAKRALLKVCAEILEESGFVVNSDDGMEGD